MAEREIATLGGGCFWCLEAAFDALAGVEKVVSGYMGGHVDNPSYEQVCSGLTGHVEVVQIRFDPDLIGYGDLLAVFFSIHDPTTLNRQGNDRGSQYRSAIFWHTDTQRAEAVAHISRLTAERAYTDPVVTEIRHAERFWPAEAYHQDYYRNHPNQPYCVFVVAPKMAKTRGKFADKLKS